MNALGFAKILQRYLTLARVFCNGNTFVFIHIEVEEDPSHIWCILMYRQLEE